MSEFEESTNVENDRKVEQKIEPHDFMKVEGLRPQLRKLNLKVRCISKSEEREGVSIKTGQNFRVTEALVGDETACILLTLWNDTIDRMKIDKVYLLTNVYTSIFKGSLRLNIGRYGHMEATDEALSEVDEENNLSNIVYAQPERRRPSYGGFNSYGNKPYSKKPKKDNWKRSFSNRKRRRRY